MAVVSKIYSQIRALYIVKTSLTSLALRSLRKISSGGVAILENADLCYVKDIKWSKIMRSQNHNFAVDNNKNPKVLTLHSGVKVGAKDLLLTNERTQQKAINDYYKE